MCKYCEKATEEELISYKNDRDFAVVFIDNTSLRLEASINYINVIEAMQINYCPICGAGVKEG